MSNTIINAHDKFIEGIANAIGISGTVTKWSLNVNYKTCEVTVDVEYVVPQTRDGMGWETRDTRKFKLVLEGEKEPEYPRAIVKGYGRKDCPSFFGTVYCPGCGTDYSGQYEFMELKKCCDCNLKFVVAGWTNVSDA